MVRISVDVIFIKQVGLPRAQFWDVAVIICSEDVR